MEREALIKLVSAAQHGDSGAMEGLFEAFYNDVYYFALKTVKDSELACDITQDTFAVIISTLKDLKEPAAFVTWMKQVAYSQCTRYFRKKKELLVTEDEDGATVFDIVAEERAEFIPSDALDQEDFRKTILGMLDELSPEQRSAVMLYYYDELSVKQIAQIQGVSEGTVKSRLNYARKAIKALVEDYEKRNDVKIHSVALLPLLYWLFASSRQAMPADAAKAAAAGISATTAATSVGSTAAAAGAKAAVAPLVAKIVAGVVAVSVAAGGIGMMVSRKTERFSSLEPTKEVIIIADTVPEAGSYIVANGPTLGPGEPLPVPASSGDQYITQDYIYKLVPFEGALGWQVQTQDKEKARYEALCTQINGCPVTKLESTFDGCANMVEAPDLPDTVRNLSMTFWNCTALREAPVLPEGVTSLWYTFSNCTALVTPPVIPASVTEMVQTFSGCASLETAPEIPRGVTDLSWTFDGCGALRLPPEIPEGVVEMQSTFAGCTSLEKAPKIPSTVVILSRTFAYCTSLQYPPEIPEGVTDISWLFFNCTALLERPEIPSTVTTDGHAFTFCSSLPEED